ncbi:MAG: hypothetical protein Q8L64_03885 [bacterium]|nr:hypothetical protein [bacterium]
MKESTSNKSLAIFLIILVAIGVAGYFYTTRDRSSDQLLVGVPVNTTAIGSDLLKALGQLNTIRLDVKIFEDKVFMSLNDIGTKLTPQTPGRPNPFAPINTSAIVSPAATTTSN